MHNLKQIGLYHHYFFFILTTVVWKKSDLRLYLRGQEQSKEKQQQH